MAQGDLTRPLVPQAGGLEAQVGVGWARLDVPLDETVRQYSIKHHY